LTEGARQAAILLFRLAGRGFSAFWEPLGAAGALAPPAAHGSRAGFAAEGEDGDGAGWAGGQTPKWAPRAGSASRVGFVAEARARRPSLRVARERSDQAGVWGRLAPMINRGLAAPPRRSGTPGRRGIRPAVTRSRQRRRQRTAYGCHNGGRLPRGFRGLAAPHEAGAARRVQRQAAARSVPRRGADCPPARKHRQRASGQPRASYQWGRPLQRQLSGGLRRTARAHQTRLVAPCHAEEKYR